MLARENTLTHPSGVRLETPLLIPSFSSKGFLFQKKKERQVSEAKGFMDLTADILTETMLVSAYDIYYKHVDNINRISKVSGLTFIDSGGYEVSDYHDYSAVFKHPTPVGIDWNQEKLKTVLDKWSDRYPSVIVSFDHRFTPLPKQIDLARKLFAGYPQQMNDFIIKPEEKKNGKYLNINAIIRYVEELRHFDIIGITEKELGDSVLNRMLNIAQLRNALDNVKITSPIHIFGSLDPLSSSLYFLAGAEIFDGLTWLRYSYCEGKAVYYHNYGTVKYGIFEDEDLLRGRTIRDNLYYIKRLKYEMKDFLHKQDFNKFEFNSKELKKAYETFQAHRGGKK